jgi:hypothetical protein
MSQRQRFFPALSFEVRALILGLVLLGPACGRGDELRRIGHTPETGLTLACTLKPQWGSRSGSTGQRPAQPDRVRIYLDVSEPMAGFLPVPPSAETSPFKTMVLSLPGRLVTAGPTRLRVEWKTFGEGLSGVVEAPRIERNTFRQGATLLDRAVSDAVEGLSSDRVQAAVLVTDLVATGDVTGAAGAARPLLDWLASTPVRSGRFHVGLLGVRAPYWGALSKACKPVRPDLGCWYSERAPGFKPLPQRALVPFYVLVLGRDDAAVERLGASLAAEATQRKLETQWELLTSASRPLPARLECTGHEPGDAKGRQYALFRGPDGRMHCRRDEKVEMSCHLQSGVGITLSTASAPGSWPEVDMRWRGDGLSVLIDCERIRDRKMATPDLDLTLTGVRGPSGTRRWQGWSSDTDEEVSSLGRTLDLDRFLERARLAPERWEIDCEPLFQGGGNRGS